ncbi:hypothetical protein [Pseudomonas sp. N2-3-1-14]|uniref:hypothetical protein n=1 Tax=Pseudomonas sp. N2-3-1-14 TaxID=3240264 RepID=UPI0035151B39
MAICKKTKADTYQLVTLIKMVEAYEAQSTHGLTSLGNQEQLLNRIEALLHKHDGESLDESRSAPAYARGHNVPALSVGRPRGCRSVFREEKNHAPSG